MINWLGTNPEVVIVLLTLVGSAIGWLGNALFSERKSTKLQEEALKILLRRELKILCDYCKKKYHANDADWKEFNDTYEVYEALYGNNGYASQLLEEMKKLKEGTI